MKPLPIKILPRHLRRTAATLVITGLLSLGMTGAALAQDSTPTDNETKPLNLISGLNVTMSIDNGSGTDVVQDAAVTDATLELATGTESADAAQAENDVALDDDTDSGNASSNDASTNDASTNDASNDEAGGLVFTLGKSSASDVGIAAIGVNGIERPFSALDSLIWRGSAATHADLLLSKGVVRNASHVLMSVSGDIVAQQSVPPTGTNKVVDEAVATRLDWLARAGRSDDLMSIVEQLPEEPAWDEWKRWLVQAQLMMMDDGAACATVKKQIIKTIDPFWHKTKVLCAIADGNITGARFAADILRGSGVDDPVFFALIEEMLNEIPAPAFDPAALTPMHVALMDIVRHEIDLDALQALPPQMAQIAVKLRYLSDEARMVSTHDALSLGLIDARIAGNLWRNIDGDAAEPESALARHISKPTALTMAMAWRALDQEKSAIRLPLIATMMQDDADRHLRGHVAPLFAALAEEAVAFEDAEQVLSELDANVTGRIALLLALDNPAGYALPASFPQPTYAKNAAQLLTALEGGSISLSVLSALDMWHLLPLLEASTVTWTEPEWLDVLATQTAAADAEPAARSMVSLPLSIMRAIDQAVKKRRVAETILLANWAIGSQALDQINPADAARLVTAMVELGQPKAARALAAEFTRAYLWAGATDAALADQVGAWIVPQAVAVDAISETGGADNGTAAEVADETASAGIIADNATADPSLGAPMPNDNTNVDSEADTVSDAATDPVSSTNESDNATVNGDQSNP